MVNEKLPHWIGHQMVFSILTEAISWPSPGLVSAIDTGSHSDMDVYLFVHSALCLQPYFERAFTEGLEWGNLKHPSDLFYSLQGLGIEAERVMFKWTKGVNTHKGIIFLGLLLAAGAGLSYKADDSFDPLIVCGFASNIASRHLESKLREVAVCASGEMTTGLRAYQVYGIRGIRGEVIDGWPTLLHHAVPEMRRLLKQGVPLGDVFCHVLILIMSSLEDTTLLNRRFDIARISYTKEHARKIVNSGSVFSQNGIRLIWELHEKMKVHNLSPGGSADLASMSLFLVSIEKFPGGGIANEQGSYFERVP